MVGGLRYNECMTDDEVQAMLGNALDDAIDDAIEQGATPDQVTEALVKVFAAEGVNLSPL